MDLELEGIDISKKKKKEPDLPNVDVAEDENILTTDEAFAKIVVELANTKNPEVLSDLSDDEIKYIAALSVVAEKTKDDMLTSFINKFLLLRVSRNRKGRLELLKVAQAAREQAQSRFSKLGNILGINNQG